jgi:ubiquinone biosynthesis protein COQ9
MPQTSPPPEVQTLLSAILPHVAFDGWSDLAFAEAARDAGMDLATARALCPRGALDLAVAYHRAGDAAMARAVAATDLGPMRYSDRVAFALRARLRAADDKEAVRRATALFALPHLAARGPG